MSSPTYVQIACTVLRDFGCRAKAIAYCENVAAQNGDDAINYKHAADSLRNSVNIREIIENPPGARHPDWIERGRAALAKAVQS
jgi:hypothetical protein